MASALLAKSRRRLDARFKEIGQREKYAAPPHGWVKAIRHALGMTSAQLAQRMGIRQPSVVALEQSEAQGTIALATLRRAAEALDCTVVYMLVPNESLDAVVRDRAREFVRRRRTAVEWSMALEGQRAAAGDRDDEVDEIIRTTKPSRFWDER